MKCHHHSSPVNLLQSIENSCNPYYANVFKRILELPEYKTVRNAYGELAEIRDVLRVRQ